MSQKIIQLVSENGCFDLQFRKDIRHERTNSPTYYRWKIQFIVTTPKSENKKLKEIQKVLGCGAMSIIKEQARFSVQKIDDIVEQIVPFFKKNHLLGNKKKDFELWHKAVDIVYRNKGIYLTKWKRNDLLSLIQIHKSSLKYKNKPKEPKWMEMALSFAKNPVKNEV